MARADIDQLHSIRDSIGEIHANADRVQHLIETVREFMPPNSTAGDALLGLAAELAEEINGHAEAVATLQFAMVT